MRGEGGERVSAVEDMGVCRTSERRRGQGRVENE